MTNDERMQRESSLIATISIPGLTVETAIFQASKIIHLRLRWENPFLTTG
jgi:hypothetical protein